MIHLLLATRNSGKLREMRALTFETRLIWHDLSEFPQVIEALEDGDSFAENARRKALHYAAATGLFTLADDSGLEVDCLDGAPGVDSAYYAGLPRDDDANNRKLAAAIRGFPPEKRTARYCCCMALVEKSQVVLETSGMVEGLIVDAPRGSGGFGYDPYFYLPKLGRTMAELPAEEKNRISHRGLALRDMLARIERRYGAWKSGS